MRTRTYAGEVINTVGELVGQRAASSVARQNAAVIQTDQGALLQAARLQSHTCQLALHFLHTNGELLLCFCPNLMFPARPFAFASRQQSFKKRWQACWKIILLVGG